MNIYCQHCNGTEGHSEDVKTKDADAEGGWEIWFCCHPCRDAGLPCETFFPYKKEAS